MRVPRIFVPQTLEEGQQLEIGKEKSNYLSNVLRMKAGRELIVFNGSGFDFQCHIAAISRKSVAILVGQKRKVDSESNLKIHLGQAISKGNRMDFALQKATELGVTEITPLLTEHCDLKIEKERLNKKMDHWQGVIVSACEQCNRSIVPKLNPPLKLQSWIETDLSPLKLILNPYESKHLQELKQPIEVSLTIGPEGGLSEEEIRFLRQNDYTSISLGPRILRTETAALAAISIIQSHWGDI